MFEILQWLSILFLLFLGLALAAGIISALVCGIAYVFLGVWRALAGPEKEDEL